MSVCMHICMYVSVKCAQISLCTYAYRMFVCVYLCFCTFVNERARACVRVRHSVCTNISTIVLSLSRSLCLSLFVYLSFSPFSCRCLFLSLFSLSLSLSLSALCLSVSFTLCLCLSFFLSESDRDSGMCDCSSLESIIQTLDLI